MDKTTSRKPLQPPITCIRCRRTFKDRFAFKRHAKPCLASRKIFSVQCAYCNAWVRWRIGKLDVALHEHYQDCAPAKAAQALPIYNPKTCRPLKAGALSNCRDLSNVRALSFDEAKAMKLTPAGFKPTYLPSAAPMMHAASSPLYLGRVDGWCQFPNMWHGDLLVCRNIEPELLHLAKGRDVRKEPIIGDELARWQKFEGRYVVVEIGGKLNVKRLHIDMRRGPNGARVHLGCDNMFQFLDWVVCTEDLPVDVMGVVEWHIAGEWKPESLPTELRAEWERIPGLCARSGKRSVRVAQTAGRA